MIKVLDPDTSFVIKWRRFALFMGVLSLILDPFFIYIPYVTGPKCVGIHVQAAIFFTFFRSLLDFFHLIHIALKFRIAFEGNGPKVFKRRNLIKDHRLIAINYIKSRFLLDVIAILPLPQVIVWSKSSTYDLQTEFADTLSIIILMQFTPRMISMVPLDGKFLKSMSIVLRNVWSGAIYNLFIFILTGHLVGALYYRAYLSRLFLCLAEGFKNEMKKSDPVVIDCREAHKICVTKYKELDYGMLSDAFSNEIGLRGFIQKCIYCFVWGVRSLSSLAQIFDASFDVVETASSCMIMITGLIFLADLIARMQTSVQSAGARREQQRVKQRKLEEWTHYHDLPPALKGRVRQSVQSKWQATKGIDNEAILNSLPLDLQCDIRTHLYKERVCTTPPFTRMDDELLGFICGHLRTFIGAEGTYIVLQGDPIEQIAFIFSGFLQLSHHTGGRSTSRSLEPGDFFGDQELLTWASSQPNASSSSQNLPLSTSTVKCLSNVEAFCLPAEDVRLLYIFNYSQKFQLALRDHHA